MFYFTCDRSLSELYVNEQTMMTNVLCAECVREDESVKGRWNLLRVWRRWFYDALSGKQARPHFHVPSDAINGRQRHREDAIVIAGAAFNPSAVTHTARDGNGSSSLTHDPWSLHHFILPMVGLGGGVEWWYWRTLSVLKAKIVH